MKCIHCDKEFKSKRATAKYCSDKCRVTAGRLSVTNKPLSVTKEPVSVTDVTVKEVSVTKDRTLKIAEESTVRKLSRQKLYTTIDSYPHDTWITSPEYKELLRRLETMSIEQLEEEGYSIPVWKRHSNSCPITV